MVVGAVVVVGVVVVVVVDVDVVDVVDPTVSDLPELHATNSKSPTDEDAGSTRRRAVRG